MSAANACPYECYVIGGPWISTNPDCPTCNKEQEVISDELCEEIISELNDIARELDPYEYGLPQWGDPKIQMIDKIKEILNKR